MVFPGRTTRCSRPDRQQTVGRNRHLCRPAYRAFLGYSQNFRQTPARRQMDYLRVLGASKESAKELKLFGLSSFFVRRYSDLSDLIYAQNVTLARRRFWAGSR